ncbi:hypothetical protein SD80_025840 [Scytonema tolypothrichoides VB-61278]|nr:hypothetical protein SD80_025840 [Scytonema tolypothrichoides VB-61278]
MPIIPKRNKPEDYSERFSERFGIQENDFTRYFNELRTREKKIINDAFNPFPEEALLPIRNPFKKLILKTFNIILYGKLIHKKTQAQEDHPEQEDQAQEDPLKAQEEDYLEQIHGSQEFSEVTINSLLDFIKYLKYFKSLQDDDLVELYKLNNNDLNDKLNTIKQNEFNLDKDKTEKRTEEQLQEIEQITKHEDQIKQLEKALKQLIKIVFNLSLKKEESWYPIFQLYIPLVTSEDNNYDDELKYNSINFDLKKTPINIDLDNFDSVARLSIGIPTNKNCALLVKTCDQKPFLRLEGIIRIEKPNLAGILLHVDAPGRLSITYTYSFKKETHEELVQVKLALVESKIREYSDPVDNPMVDIFAFKLAKNICNNINQTENQIENQHFKLKIDKLINKKKFYKNLFPPIINIIKKLFNDILTLAVDYGHGGQFVIFTEELEKVQQKDIDQHLNIRYCVVQEQDIKKRIQYFLVKYVNFLFEFENINDRQHTLRYDQILSSYDQLVSSYNELGSSYNELLKSVEKYTDSIATLSTIDGSIILNSNLELIGFGGQTISKSDQENNAYFRIKIDSTYNGEEDSPHDNWDKPEEISKFYSNHFKRDAKWDLKKYGTRHQSAARLCNYATELEPFIFVVSQTGDIREFMRLEDENGRKYVGVLGPLRPL